MSCSLSSDLTMKGLDPSFFIKHLHSIDEFEIKSCLGLKLLEFSIQGGTVPNIEKKMLVRFTKISQREEFFLLLALHSLNSLLIRTIRLSVPCIGAETLKQVLRKSDKLEEFKIKKSDEADLSSLLETLGTFCPQLMRLFILQAEFVKNLDFSRLRGCQKLEILEISDYRGELERGLISYLQSSGKFLSKINLNGCVDVTENLLKTIAVACPNLTVLNLGNCIHLFYSHLRHLNRTSITHLSLEAFYGEVKEIKSSEDLFLGLTELSLCRCKGAREIVEIFQNKWSALTEIDLSQCEAITIEVLRSLLCRVKTLCRVNIQGNPYEEEDLKELKREFPNVILLNEILFGDS